MDWTILRAAEDAAAVVRGLPVGTSISDLDPPVVGGSLDPDRIHHSGGKLMRFGPPKTVGIMSMQRIRNYGSSLQAYALKRLIESLDNDVEVSFVDFKPGQPLMGISGVSAPKSRLERALSKMGKYREVGAGFNNTVRFVHHKRTYAKKYFPMLELPLQHNRTFGLDVQVIGSDEVFNCTQANAEVGYTRELFAHGSSAKKVISYAASFGNTTLEKLDRHGIAARVAEDLAAFSALSVRDPNSAQIVESLTGQAPAIHVDPVLAYDYMAMENRIPSARLHDRRYIIVYGYGGRFSPDEGAAVRRYARSIDADILCLGGVQGCCDRFIDCNPFELLAYFRDASAVLTDTFHGTIFSIINGIPVGVFVRPSVGEGYGNEEKLLPLLNLFNLESQRLDDIRNLEETIDTMIDARTIVDRLKHERQRTLNYLKHNVL